MLPHRASQPVRRAEGGAGGGAASMGRVMAWSGLPGWLLIVAEETSVTARRCGRWNRPEAARRAVDASPV